MQGHANLHEKVLSPQSRHHHQSLAVSPGSEAPEREGCCMPPPSPLPPTPLPAQPCSKVRGGAPHPPPPGGASLQQEIAGGGRGGVAKDEDAPKPGNWVRREWASLVAEGRGSCGAVTSAAAKQSWPLPARHLRQSTRRAIRHRRRHPTARHARICRRAHCTARAHCSEPLSRRRTRWRCSRPRDQSPRHRRSWGAAASQWARRWPGAR